jgi:anhydro-N-acetylmuramic acid kinase
MTGGGVFNTFLVELLRHSVVKLVIPDPILIKYKEALVFGLLGLLRYRGEINCLASVTGGKRDLSCGVIHVVDVKT